MANQFTVTFEFTPSYYQKINNYIYPQIIRQVLSESGEELLQYIKEETPVRTGRLRDGHMLEKKGNWINITNEAYYWKYVVWMGNDYISRGLLQFINSKIVEENTIKTMQQAGIL